MANVVVAWNTQGMPAALDGIRAAGAEPPSEDVRRVAPTNLKRIKLRGTLDFPVEKYADRILPGAVSTSHDASSPWAARGTG